MSGKEELSEEEFPLLHHDTLVESGDLESAATPVQTPQKKAMSTTTPQLTTLPPLTHELRSQARLAVPTSINLIANYLLNVISLAFVGQLGTQELAAAALGTTLYSMSAKILLQGLLGAMDTYASQAVGAQNFAALGSMFRQGVLFLWLHTIPIAALFGSTPHILHHFGQPENLTRMVGPYLWALMPAVWIDAIFRPFNRILMAQGVALPQMWISCLAAVQHVAASHLFINTWGFGYMGAAYATVWTSALVMVLLAAYVWATSLSATVWEVGPAGTVFQNWRDYMKLSYSAAAMMCIESWSLSLCTVAAGWLPDPESAVAAMAVAFNIYGVILMGFAGLRVAACTRVGHGLGAGSAPRAKQSARAAAAAAPLCWVLVAALLAAPPSQRLLIRAFTASDDPVLLGRLRDLLHLIILLVFFDGGQGTLSGMAAGAGKQTKGFLINILAHWCVGLPSALLLGFHFHLGVQGLYAGLVLGPLTQFVCYLVLILRMNWEREAHVAHSRMLAVRAEVSADAAAL